MQLPSTRTINIVTIALCVLLLFLLLRQGCKRSSPTATPATELRYDTTYIASKPVEILVPAPYPKYIKEAKDTEQLYTLLVEDSTYSPYAEGYKDATEAFAKARRTCRDTAYYNDTITSADKWQLVLIESLTGNRIISRTPYVTDLRPIITKTISTALPATKERIRFYAGAEVLLNARHSERWGIALSGLLTIPQGYGVRYAYDLHNNTHSAGAYVLLRIKK